MVIYINSSAFINLQYIDFNVIYLVTFRNITIAYFLVFLAALYLTSVSILAGFWGQFFVRRFVAFLGRASIIVFILSGVIFASALTMGKANQHKLMITIFFLLMWLIYFAWKYLIVTHFFFLSGVVGIENSIEKINNHEFMGFLGFCSSQWYILFQTACSEHSKRRKIQFGVKIKMKCVVKGTNQCWSMPSWPTGTSVSTIIRFVWINLWMSVSSSLTHVTVLSVLLNLCKEKEII